MTSLTTLYRTGRLKILQHDCDCSAGHGESEEASRSDEIAFVQRGVFQKRSRDANVTLDPTRIAIFRKNEPYRITHPVEGGDRSIVVEFDPAELSTAFAAEEDASGTLLHRVPAMLPATPPLIILTARLYRIARTTAPDGLLIEETAYAILDELSASASRVHRSSGTVRPEKPCALNVAAHVSSRYRSTLSVDGIASALNVSAFHLCHSFREATGTTIHRYITTLRMSEAVRRVRDYRNNLTELALDLGYSSHSHFSATFRRYFGITPSDVIEKT